MLRRITKQTPVASQKNVGRARGDARRKIMLSRCNNNSQVFLNS